MEEVPAYMHPGPIVPDVLTRQHEYRYALIWSGDHETCIIDLHCKRFDRKLFQAYSTAPYSFRVCTTDRESPSPTSDLSLVAYSCMAASATPACSARPSCSTWCNVVHIVLLQPVAYSRPSYLPYHDCGLVPFDLWQVEVPLICYEIVEYHLPKHVMRQFAHISLYRLHDIMRIYIDNPANRNTRTVGYQSTRVNRWMMEVDDMSTRVIQEPPSSLTQIASFAKKVQTIIRMCMLSHRHPREPISDHGARGVKKGARRLPGEGERRDRVTAPPHLADENILTPNVEEREVRDLEDVDVEI
ncbi:hypothetical protein M9H77_27620 [Catharanthus roseus]|uniref:Uncharacterized protein n=1 Tax=Catharanthus roseus TaxID=4058 RepID=A0ACC0AD08_CATRO|nr:hypothetical protein M9H77_27620 [Catharanthus roseus]